MRRWFFGLGMLAGLLALAACAAQEKEATPEPAAPAAPEAILPRKDAWQEEWERVLAAAKREGKVAVLGGAGTEIRQSLTEPFERRYGIKVEYLGGRGGEQTERVRAERAAGQYLWDVAIVGLTSWVPYLDDMLDPVAEALILPDAKAPQNWWEGKLHWLDEQRRILATSMYTANPIFINTKLVKPEELRSLKDLLDPKWKGKLLVDDPRIAGPSLALFSFFDRHPELGPNFIRALARQDLTITRDRTQQFEWLALGRFPILLGGSQSLVGPLIREGLPIANLDPRGVKEGAFIAVGQGHLLHFKKAPHPNAARVYINWFMTKEGQESYTRALGIPTLRTDSANDWVKPWELPQPGYIRMIGPEDERFRDRTRRFLTELLGS